MEEPAERPGANGAGSLANLSCHSIGLRFCLKFGHPLLHEIEFSLVHGRCPLSSFHPFVADRNDGTDESPLGTS
jgi:hypothetical protein